MKTGAEAGDRRGSDLVLNKGGLMERKGEKIGWLAGWLGGFLWVLILAIIFMAQGKLLEGGIGLFLVAVAAVIITLQAPWRHPTTGYWKLMLAPYGVFLVSVVWVIWSFGGMAEAGLDWWMLVWFLPMMIPLGSLSKKTWSTDDSETTADENG